MGLMPEPPKTVIFDMDGVLCHYDFAKRLELLSRATGKSAEFIDQAIWKSGFDDAADRGAYASEDYIQGFAARLGIPFKKETWIAARRDCMRPDPAVLDLVRQLSKTCRVAMLTNNGPVLKEAIDKIFPAAHELFGEHVYVSCQFGVSKPDPTVFLNVLECMGASAEESMFIDDRQKYADGAAKAGLRAYVFTDFASLKRELLRLGLF